MPGVSVGDRIRGQGVTNTLSVNRVKVSRVTWSARLFQKHREERQNPRKDETEETSNWWPTCVRLLFSDAQGGFGGYFEDFVIIYHHMPPWKHQLGITKKRNNQLLLPFFSICWLIKQLYHVMFWSFVLFSQFQILMVLGCVCLYM